MLQLCVLASGSRGNATLIRHGSACIMIDCGLTQKQLGVRLQQVGLDPADINAVLVTHEHTDHCSGISAMQRKLGVPIFATAGTWRGMRLQPGAQDGVIKADSALEVAGFSVHAVTVPHDAREPVQYRCTSAGRTLGVITDLGHATPHVVEQYQGCDGLLLECNHDPQMLQGGSYPASLKRRVGGRFGHLANGQSAGLLAALGMDRLQFVVAGHLSEQNNTPDHACGALAEVIDGRDLPLQVAAQHEPTPWFALN